MKLLKNPFFLIAGFCYLSNRFLFSCLGLHHYKIPYLNDILCLPVALTFALVLQQFLFPASARQRLNPAQVIFAFLYFSIFFEGVLPFFSGRYTRDLFDVPAYAIGGFAFYFFLNPKPRLLQLNSGK